jgi:hypothetical protein
LARSEVTRQRQVLPKLNGDPKILDKVKQRSSEEGWFPRNEIVRFVLSQRYVANPVNFAKAMAGFAWVFMDSFTELSDSIG